MRTWRSLPEERLSLYSPIGLRLLDEFSGSAPIGSYKSLLDIRDDQGQWRNSDIEAVLTRGGVVTYPGLGRRVDPVGHLPERYRIRVNAQYYRPLYQMDSEGIEFDVHFYNDLNPPASVPTHPQSEFLTPAVNYPFESHVRVLYGVVMDQSREQIPDVLVTESSRERVLSDERGAFALPLRQPGETEIVIVDAVNQRTGLTGQIAVSLPNGIEGNHEITIS